MAAAAEAAQRARARRLGCILWAVVLGIVASILTWMIAKAR